MDALPKVQDQPMHSELVQMLVGSVATMTPEEFVRICMRHFSIYGIRWKWRVAEIFGRRWNTVWCYAAGRRPIPRFISDVLLELDRLRDKAEAELATETHEEQHLAFLRIMDQLRVNDA